MRSITVSKISNPSWSASGRLGLAPKAYPHIHRLKFRRRLSLRTLTWTTDPENMLVMLQTWQSGDCSQQEPYNGNFEQAMACIKAKTLVLPSKTDLYFPPEDSDYEVANMKPGVGTLAVFPSIWGHWAGKQLNFLSIRDSKSQHRRARR